MLLPSLTAGENVSPSRQPNQSSLLHLERYISLSGYCMDQNRLFFIVPVAHVYAVPSFVQQEASPVPVHCAHLTSDSEPSLLIAYGSTAKPQFETLVSQTSLLNYCSSTPPTIMSSGKVSG